MVRTIRRSYFGVFAVLAAMALLCVLAGSSTAASGSTTLVSVDSSGKQANPGFSGESDMSDNGRYVAFTSSSSNLISGDTNTFRDVFVHDRDADEDGVFNEVNEPGAISTERVSVASDGTEANADSSAISISANGRYVAFLSAATNLVPNDTSRKDVFVRDRDADEDGVFDEVNEPGAASTKRASGDSNGNEANGASYEATDVSSNGRVAFISAATNLVSDDTNGQLDFFVHDLNTGTTERVNVDNDGHQVNGGSAIDISISSNGRYVGFTTNAPNLVPDDPGDVWDGFVRDLDPVQNQTQTIWRVAYSASGAPSISDGGRVAFTSYAPNLVPNDTNGVDDVFVRDQPDEPIQRVSVDSSENQANGRSFFRPSISADGRYVAFDSLATNLDLAKPDADTFRDVFVRDLQAQTTEMVSVNDSGIKGNGNSFFPSISADGRYVAFNSGASNLDADRPDTNNGGDVFVRDRQTDTTQPKDLISPSTTASAITTSGAPYEPGTWTNEDVKLTLSARDDEGGSGVKEIRYSATGAQSIPETVYDPQNAPIISTEGATTVSYYATDNAGNRESPAKTFTIKLDKTAPAVGTVSPTNAATGVPLTANAEATFSEAMDQATLTSATFTLTKQSTTSLVAAQVTYDSASQKVILDANSNLEANTTYTARVESGSTGAKDIAGNALAQDYSWTFTTAAPPAPSCTIPGTSGNDVLEGTSGDDVICGAGGSDTIKGLGGNDILKGEAGNDILLGGVGNDTLDGGTEIDTASYSASLTAVVASLATNSSTGEGTDTFAGVENLLGSPQADTLTGSEANNTLTGGGGNDTEHGGLGNDSVVGSGGADSLFGDENDDAVNSKDGVKGNDSLDGGTGTDTKVTDRTEKSIVGFP